MKKTGVFILFYAFCQIAVFGQSSFECGTEKIHQMKMQNDIQYRNAYNLMQQQVRDQIANFSNHGYRMAVSKVPVVVHVIHLGETVGNGSNISDTQISDAILGLNDRWRNIIGTSVDITLEFCLARIDPNGNPTNGINRVDGSGVTNYTSLGLESSTGNGADELTIKNLSRWSNTQYYNIWVVHNIVGGVAGYAYYPTTNILDGTVLEDDYMTYSSLVLAHEVGHAFNLPHTFYGDFGDSICPINNNCLTDGDEICDTPPHKQNDCGSTNPCTVSGIWDNSRYNYMSYCFASMANSRFTADQKTRALAAASVFPRSELLNNDNVCECSSNADCADTNPCTLDTCIGGICTNILSADCIISSFPACEDFESFSLCGTSCGDACTLIHGWTNLTTDSIDWAVDANGTPSSGTGPSSDHTLGNSSGKYVYTEASTPCFPSKLAIMLSPGYDFTNIASPILEFWYNMNGNGADMGTLALHIESPYGANNWSQVFSISGNQGTNWLQASMDLSPYAGNTVRLRFTGATGATINGFSSDMALDDICVDGTPVLSVSGSVFTENGNPIVGAIVTFSGSEDQTDTTDIDGIYGFKVAPGASGSVVPIYKDELTSTCISAIDLVRIQRHILVIDTLETLYKIIAADVNGSGNVSAIDIGKTRGVILGNDTVFPDGKLWRFANSDNDFTDSIQPFPFDTNRTYQNLSSDTINQNFIGIRLGDVNGTCDQSNPRLGAAGEVKLMMEEYVKMLGEEIIIPVKVKDFKNITGYQFTLSWNPEVLSFLEVNNVSLSGFFGTNKTPDGFLTTLWSDETGGAKSLDDEAVAFELKFEVVGAIGSFSPITIGSEITTSEAYNGGLELLFINSINGRINVGDITTHNPQPTTLNNLQVQPNPFNNSTNIIFNITKSETVTLSIYDLLGKEVKHIQAIYPVGEHKIEWEGDDKNGSPLSAGLYHIRLKAGNETHGVKVAIIR